MAKSRDDAEPLPRTLEEFDAWHERQPGKWEFISGDVIQKDSEARMMAPGSMRHTVIKTALGASLVNKLRGKPCKPLSDGAQIKTEDISAIPDLVVSCPPFDFESRVVEKPVVIVEVLSPTTAYDDFHRKRMYYQKIASLQHYAIVAQDAPIVTLHTRTGVSSWKTDEIINSAVRLDAIDVTLSVEDVFGWLTFENIYNLPLSNSEGT